MFRNIFIKYLPHEVKKYRKIKSRSRMIKLIERVIGGMLRNVVEINDNQFAFILARSTTVRIPAVELMTEKYRKT